MRLAVGNPIELLTDGIAFNVAHGDLDCSIHTFKQNILFLRFIRMSGQAVDGQKGRRLSAWCRFLVQALRVDYAHQNLVVGDLGSYCNVDCIKVF